MIPRVSIVMAAYNVERYVDKAIQSVMDQTLKDFELIVVNDGSTDGTRERVLSYKESRIILIDEPVNRGPSYCRNVALSRARGDYVTILDADDWWSSERLERLLIMASRYGADVAFDNLWLIDDGQEAPWSTYFDEVRMPFWEGQLRLESLAARDFGALKPLLRRDWLLTPPVIRFRETLSVGEDYEFMLRCLARRPVLAATSSAGYFYRRRKGSLVSDTANSLAKLHAAAEDMLRSGESYPEMEWVIRRRIRLLDQALQWESLREAYLTHSGWGILFLIVRRPRLIGSLVLEVPRWLRRVGRRHSTSMKDTPSFSGR